MQKRFKFCCKNIVECLIAEDSREGLLQSAFSSLQYFLPFTFYLPYSQSYVVCRMSYGVWRMAYGRVSYTVYCYTIPGIRNSQYTVDQQPYTTYNLSTPCKLKGFDQTVIQVNQAVRASFQCLFGGWRTIISLHNQLATIKKSALMDSKSNDDFRTIMEEAETGIFTTKKTFVPPAVSTKSLGTWEKHTKGVSISNLICIRY